MSLKQSPPTTSGIVVISGSNFFDPLTSDFPVVQGVLAGFNLPRNQMNFLGSDPQNTSALLISGSITGGITISLKERMDFPGFVPDATEDTDITTTSVTTSGVVVLDIFPGAGTIFVVPVVGNERLFPIFQGEFPVQDIRIFPVLPQFSTIIIS